MVSEGEHMVAAFAVPDNIKTLPIAQDNSITRPPKLHLHREVGAGVVASNLLADGRVEGVDGEDEDNISC